MGSYLADLLPCPLDYHEARNLVDHDRLLVIRQIVQRAVTLHHPLAEGGFHRSLQLAPGRSLGGFQGLVPLPAQDNQFRPPLGRLLPFTVQYFGAGDFRLKLAPQTSEPAHGVGPGIVDHTRLCPGGQLGCVLPFNRNERAVEKEGVDVGPNVLVVERDSASLCRVVLADEEEFPFILQKPQELFPVG
jgi:hypothetical protein